jgi:hypothetical protein
VSEVEAPRSTLEVHVIIYFVHYPHGIIIPVDFVKKVPTVVGVSKEAKLEE